MKHASGKDNKNALQYRCAVLIELCIVASRVTSGVLHNISSQKQNAKTQAWIKDGQGGGPWTRAGPKD